MPLPFPPSSSSGRIARHITAHITARVAARAAARVAVANALVLAGACGDGRPTGPVVGSLAVQVETGGALPDPDGYTIVVDGKAVGPVAATGTTTVPDVVPGDHTLALDGVSANCSVVGTQPLAVRVSRGAPTRVRLDVDCPAPPPPPGAAAVSVATTGDDQDADGYLVGVDGGAPQPLAAGATLELPDLAAGPHAFTLSSVAANCSVAGENPRTVAIAAGSATAVTFAVACRTRVARVVVGRRLPSLFERDTTLLTAAALAADGTVLEGRQVTWTSAAPAIADVAAQPAGAGVVVTGGAPGRATVTASVEGVAGSVVVAVLSRAPRPNRELSYVDDSASADRSSFVYRLRIASPDGTGTRTVTPPGQSVISYAWAPDGARLALSGYTMTNGGYTGLFTLGLDGAGPRPLTAGFGRDLAWAPQGDRVLFTRGDPLTDAAVLVAEPGGEARRVGTGTGPELHPRWSPDGRRIAYARGPLGGAPELWVADVDGAEPPRRLAVPIEVHDHQWSPDGKRLVITDQQTVWVVDADGANARHVVGPCAPTGECRNIIFGDPVWSGDGAFIAYTRRVAPPFGDTVTVDVVRPNGSVLATIPNLYGPLRWSPDHTLLLAGAMRPGQTRSVVTVRRDGSERRTVEGAANGGMWEWRP